MVGTSWLVCAAIVRWQKSAELIGASRTWISGSKLYRGSPYSIIKYGIRYIGNMDPGSIFHGVHL